LVGGSNPSRPIAGSGGGDPSAARKRAKERAMDNAELETGAVVRFLRERIPGLRSVHLFGSRKTGDWTPESDVDLSVLADDPMDPVERFRIAADLSAFVGADVDLVDRRTAPALLKNLNVTEGERLWALDWRSEDYELAALREKADWDIELREQREDIRRTGTVHARL